MFCCALLYNLSSFVIIMMGKKRAGYFTLFVFLLSCDCNCSIALPHGGVGWSVVCDCCIARSYSLAFFYVNFNRVLHLVFASLLICVLMSHLHDATCWSVIVVIPTCFLADIV